ncbi:MAG: TolC family protein [Cyclobacteriaceae bacterium]
MRKLVLAAVLAGTFTTGWAQKKVLTFEEAISTALRNSVLINQQRNNLENTQMQRNSNMAGLGPTVGVSATAMRVDGNTFNQQQGRVINGIFDQVSGSLNVNWTLFNGFGQVNRARQSSELNEAQAFYIKRTTQDVVSSVTGAYLQVLLDAELLRIARENLTAQTSQLTQVSEQVNLGSKSAVDEYNQRSQVKAAEIRALSAEITLVNDRALLAQILLLEPSEEFEVVKPGWTAEAAVDAQGTLDGMLERAMANRADYQRAIKNEDAARHGMYAQKAALTPSLVAFGTLYSAYNHTHDDPTVRPFNDQFKNDNLRKYYGVQLNIPILGGAIALQNRANYVQSRVSWENFKVLRKGAEIQLRTDVVRTWQNFRLFHLTMNASREQLQAAEEANKLETERYNLGITNFVDYANAFKVLVQAQTDAAQAEYRLLFQKVLMDYATGVLKPEDFQ